MKTDFDFPERYIYRLLTMQHTAPKYFGGVELLKLYEETGDPQYHVALTHLILDELIERAKLRKLHILKGFSGPRKN